MICAEWATIWIRSRKIWINKQCGVNMRFEMKEGGTIPQRHSAKNKKMNPKILFFPTPIIDENIHNPSLQRHLYI